MEDIQADIERTIDRIDRELAEAEAREELASSDLKQWHKALEEEAERRMRELEERTLIAPNTPTDVQPPAQPVDKKSTSDNPSRFDILDIPPDATDQTATNK